MLDRTLLGPTEIITAAALRLMDSFRASAVIQYHPDATETLFFWRHFSENYLADIMRGFSDMLGPKASDRFADMSIVIGHIHDMTELLWPCHITPADSMSPPMIERARLARKTFERLVKVLKTACAGRETSSVNPSNDKGEAATVSTWHEEVKTPIAGQPKGHDDDEDRLSAIGRSIVEPRDLCLDSGGNRLGKWGSGKRRPPNRHSGARAATIISQPESVPGQNGVPFLAKDRSHGRATKEARSGNPAAPGPSAPRENLVDFNRNRRVCYRFASGIGCDPKVCAFEHDHIPEGYCRRVERQRRKPTPRWKSPRL